MAEISKPDFTNIWSSGGALVSPSVSKIQTGWTAEVPPFQWENWAQNRQDQGIAHILQHGISVWDNLTEYQANKSYVQGSDGVVYKAKQTHSNQNPVSDTTQTYWSKALATGSLLNVQVFTASGTYTPTVGMGYVIIEVQGGGGAGGGAATPSAGNMSLGAPGGSGAYGKGYFTSASVGASKVVTIGGPGAAGIAVAGTNGGSTSVGSLISAAGGIGGSILNNQVPPQYNGNGASTASPVGANIISFVGNCCGLSYAQTASFGYGGFGGAGNFGGGAPIVGVNTSAPSALNYGAGGGGVVANSASSNLAGGNGRQGVVIIWEYAL